MPFTDRFVAVPIKVFNLKEKELTGNEVCVDSFLKFNPFELSNYNQSFDDENAPGDDCVQITLKNGYTAILYLSLKEFETILNTHQQ